MKHSSKNLLGIAALSLIFSPLAAQSALACGKDTEAQWRIPDTSTPAISIDAAIASLASSAGVTVEKAQYQSMCSSDTDYIIKDKSDGQYLGTVPVPYASGIYLMARVEQLLTPSKEHAKTQMKNLSAAWKAFDEDSEILRGSLGVRFSNPGALPLKDQFPDTKKQLLYATTEYCGDPGKKEWSYISSHILLNNVLQNTFSYIPGRTDYSEETVYKDGDLKHFVLDNKDVYNALLARARHNARFCGAEGYKDTARAANWEDITRRLEHLSPDR